ncbi:DUF4244 domain-containing protein [Streptomyces sp. HNM0575]|uniref:DUF4244 domain-containing protein n=1 Tax=Streptomyces sp. HNM0575 TaxID=2716338 RepID=UPI00145F5ACD|nr:DUF4244 domain-containing protein [Streptomyces sp. HNM0575]NLU75541.1 DUF4244 domain-containing protein [Streptomyces sp. HNM0575]
MAGKIRRAVRTSYGRTTSAVRRRVREIGGQLTSDAGMSTAEYAVGTIAACGFAAVLYKVVTSGAVSGEMQQLIERALHARF